MVEVSWEKKKSGQIEVYEKILYTRRKSLICYLVHFEALREYFLERTN